MIEEVIQQSASIPFTKEMALSILKAEFNSFNEGLIGINNDTRKFIINKFPELLDSDDCQITMCLVMDTDEPNYGNLTGAREDS